MTRSRGDGEVWIDVPPETGTVLLKLGAVPKALPEGRLRATSIEHNRSRRSSPPLAWSPEVAARAGGVDLARHKPLVALTSPKLRKARRGQGVPDVAGASPPCAG